MPGSVGGIAGAGRHDGPPPEVDDPSDRERTSDA
jgi:hypothetical protein